MTSPTTRCAPRRKLAAKRAVDIAAAAGLLVVTSPVFAAVAVYVAVRDGRPVLFRQERVGRHGRPFTMLKFRSMTTDAEHRRQQLDGHNQRTGPLFKVDDDPRITRSGRFLRRTSLDELPQFLNVLGGSMSMVGPRPALPAEVEHFPAELRRREEVRPGITGLWQLDGRTDADFGKYTELDLRYVEQWSVWLDLKILVRTPVVVVRHALARHDGRDARASEVTTHPDLGDMEQSSTPPASVVPGGMRPESPPAAVAPGGSRQSA